MAVTRNEKDRIASLIMNDTKEIQQTADDLLLFAQNFYIGRKSVGNSRFQGYIRDVKLFERVLNDAEIAEIRGEYLGKAQKASEQVSMGLNDYCKLRAHMAECSFEPSYKVLVKVDFQYQ